MPPVLNILVDPDVSHSLIFQLDQYLFEVFSFNKIEVITSVTLPSSCWNKSRSQFDAACLLSFTTSFKSTEIVLLIISKDAYVSDLNFAFGVASRGLGAVVSVYRLENDPEFLQKEITHELGHVFGLKHCSLPCVMTYSNSRSEARLKNRAFCQKCLKLIKRETCK
ncbi:MAG: Zn-dependent protease [Promethearchaeota archaeon]